MTQFQKGHHRHPCSPTSPTRTLDSDTNDALESIDHLDPLFPDIMPAHLMDDSYAMQQHGRQPYPDHDMPSPSASLHDSSASSSAPTPSPVSQYDVLHTDKHVMPSDLLPDNDNNSYMISTVELPDSYHRLTAAFYARSSNMFDSNNDSTDATSPLINESSMDDNLQIRVLGVPNHGAKSRVETQIKLCIQLLTSTGTKVPSWSYLRLPETMLARSKLRKSQQQKLLDGSVATMVSDESKVLTLDARVICSTDASRTVRMCTGCVRRERKRAERTKDGKPRYEADLTPTSGDSHDKDLKHHSAENMVEKDRDRILLFNCSPMVNFSSGDTILPTRITCYCRHHNEKVGFRIQFVMRNHQGSVVAKGCSPPIMITDDHKSSKQRNNSISDGSTNDNSTTTTSRKRGRSDFEINQQSLDTPAPSRRGSLSNHHHHQHHQPSASITTPLQMNPSASFIIPSSASSPYELDHPSPPADSTTTPASSLSSSPQMMLIGNDLAMTPLPPIDEPTPYTYQHPISQADTIQTSYLMNGPPQQDVTTMNYNSQHPVLTSNNDNDDSRFHFSQPANTVRDNEAPWPQNRRRRLGNHEDGTFYESEEIAASPVWRRPDHQNTPHLERLVPAQGPTYGGVEVTVLGSGFYRGLTCLFGENAASTVYWNPNTLVCVLPPAATPGPVLVSFKEHPIFLEGQDVPLFTYYDASDQALLELALQVVGMKMTGKLHDAKHIAMLIVRGDQQRSQQQQQQQYGSNHTGQQDGLERDYSNDDQSTVASGDDDDNDDDDSLDAWTWREGGDLETHILNALEASNIHDLMQTNPSGHTMLHLAVLLRYGALTKMLLHRMADRNVIDQPDRNGCTALHLACLSNNAPMVQLLLEAGAEATGSCCLGSTLALATDPSVRSLLLHALPTNAAASLLPSSPSSSSLSPPPLPRRLSFKSHVRRFYTLKPRGDDASVAATNDLDRNGLGFVQYKHDRRLFLFWLPLLIVTVGLLYYQILGDRTLLTLLQDMIPFRHHGVNSIVGY